MRKTMIKSILAGIAISIGGIAYLSCEDKFVGASLFSIGLFMVCTFDLSLYTGKVCYSRSVKEIALTWLGNLIGTAGTGTAIGMTRLSELSVKAAKISQLKISDNLFSIFVLSMLCNMMIYVGVESYKNNQHFIGKYMGMYLSIVVFIMAGFEHCVANMFYFTLADAWSLKTITYLLVMTIGNAVGGIGFARLRGVSK